jgi:hypothetical protein
MDEGRFSFSPIPLSTTEFFVQVDFHNGTSGGLSRCTVVGQSNLSLICLCAVTRLR